MPPDDSSQTKNSAAQTDSSPEDSQVLQEFPWLKSLKSTGEVATPSEALAAKGDSESQEPATNESSQGGSKKKKRGGSKKKGQAEPSEAIETPPDQQQKSRKSNKKGKSSVNPQPESISAETIAVSQANNTAKEPVNEQQELESEGPAEPLSETPVTELSEELSEQAPPPRQKVLSRTLMEMYVSNLIDDKPDESQIKPEAPEAVTDNTNPTQGRVAKTLLETDISKFVDNPERSLEQPPQSGQPSENAPVEEPNRVVAKTLLDTDVSKFIDSQPSDTEIKNATQEFVQDNTPPTTRVAKTMLEVDITKFAENPQSPVVESQQVEQPVQPAPAQEEKRVVAKTLLETDVSKFIDQQQANPADNIVAPEPVPQQTPPANRVAKTLLEIDIAKFTDILPTPASDEASQVEQLSESAPPTQPNQRVVPKTLLETDISKFKDVDLLANPSAQQSTENTAPSENRVVPKTLLETDISSFTNTEQPALLQPEPTGSLPPETPPRTVAKTILETDISKFSEANQPSNQYSDNFINSPQPMGSQSSPHLSRADSPSFADVEMPQEINLVQQQSPAAFVPQQPDPGFQPDQNVYQPYDQQHHGAQTADRDAPKTLLDMDLIQTTLGNAIVRMEAAAEEQKLSQPVRKLEPIVDFKLTSPNCPWRWDEPHAKERIAFCEQCGQQAYNFDGLQMPEALKLIFQRENIDKPNLFKREDGKFMTKDCAIARKKAATPLLIVGVCLLLIAFVALVFVVMPKSETPAMEQTTTQPTTTGESSVNKSETTSTKSETNSTKSSTSTSSQPVKTTAPTRSGSGTTTGIETTTVTPTEVIHTRVYDRNPSMHANSTQHGNTSTSTAPSSK